jgi:hypothetical protein
MPIRPAEMFGPNIFGPLLRRADTPHHRGSPVASYPVPQTADGGAKAFGAGRARGRAPTRVLGVRRAPVGRFRARSTHLQ